MHAYVTASLAQVTNLNPYHDMLPLCSIFAPGGWVCGGLTEQSFCMVLLYMQLLIGVSLSEPHTSVTSLRCACVYFVWLDLAVTVNFISANFTCMYTIIFNEPRGIVNHLPVRQTMAPTKTETTCGPTYSLATEHHEHSASSVATLTKTEIAYGPTAMASHIPARLLQL